MLGAVGGRSGGLLGTAVQRGPRPPRSSKQGIGVPKSPVRVRGPRGRRLTSWRTPWTTTRGRGCRGTILAAGLGGDSPGAGLAHRRSGRRTGGRTERRDTPPAVPAHGALPGSGQTPALPRRSARSRSARRAAMAGGRRAEAGGRRRRCPAPPAGHGEAPSHSPQPGPAAPRWRNPPGPRLRGAVPGAARPRRASSEPRCPGRGSPALTASLKRRRPLLRPWPPSRAWVRRWEPPWAARPRR